jgi:hypothetical protein
LAGESIFFLPVTNKKGVSIPRGYPTYSSPVHETQPIVYEQGYDKDDLDQYSAALKWPSDDDMLQPEAIYQQTITNKTYQNFSGESHTQEPFSHDSKIVDVFKAHTVSEDPKDAEE